MDGTLIPIVEAPDAVDENGNPVVHNSLHSGLRNGWCWRSREEFQPKFAPLHPDDAGDSLPIVRFAGMGATTQVHGVGDGAL